MIKGSSKIKCCKFAWSCKNFARLSEIDQIRKIDCKNGSCFAWICENLAQSCKMVQKAANAAIAPLISHDHAKLILFVRNGWKSCEMLILLPNSRLLKGENSRRPLKWCQVSTWPWHINRLEYLIKEAFWHFDGRFF